MKVSVISSLSRDYEIYCFFFLAKKGFFNYIYDIMEPFYFIWSSKQICVR